MISVSWVADEGDVDYYVIHVYDVTNNDVVFSEQVSDDVTGPMVGSYLL